MLAPPRTLERLWRRSRVRGLAVTLSFARSGARVHPTARLDVDPSRVQVGAGAKVSERCVVEGAGRVALGAGVWLAHDVEISAPEPGDHVAVGSGTTIQRRSSLNGNVSIGAECQLAPNVFVSSGTHEAGVPDRPVRIGDEVWVGVNAVVMPGVTIGDRAIVGANAVVTRDVGPGEVVAGVPARVLRTRD